MPMAAATLIVIGIIVVAANIATVWFGRKLAQYRERTGYVRDEDLH